MKSLFDHGCEEESPFPAALCLDLAPNDEPAAFILRPYQRAAIDHVFAEWRSTQSTLIVMPTGSGKTSVFAEIIRRIQPRRALVLAHREELIYQATKRIESLGIETSIEMAALSASTSEFLRAPVVVSTVQTQCAGSNGNGRMTRFAPSDFDLVVIDEAHHSPAASYRRILDYYCQNPVLKVLGVTATPDRADEAALGQVFDSVAYNYEILDAIHDGWLVPVVQEMVSVEGLDYSHVRTTAGDLNGADLAAIMEAERNVQEIAAAAIQIIGERKTLIFTASVKQAEALANVFNRHRPGMADWICGATPKPQRHQTLRTFASGKTQVLANCAVLTEGFDEVGIEVVVQARPTKSRNLYAQMIGRGLRPLAGVVDDWDNTDDRRQEIANSAKPILTVIDFVGNAGKHKLISTADLLGGKYEDEVIELATRRAQKAGRPTRTQEELEKAFAEIETRKQQETARKARLVAKATYQMSRIDPFGILDIAPERMRGWDCSKTLSQKQAALLRKQGIDPNALPYGQAKALINEMFRRWNGKLCTIKQGALLRKFGYDDIRELTMAEASKRIDALAKNGWRRNNP